MKNFKVEAELFPYIGMAFCQIGVKDFVVSKESGNNMVQANISNREMRKCIRKARALKATYETGIRCLCREDVGNSQSGIIPEEEKYWFDLAAL